jgi:hypothetical protein
MPTATLLYFIGLGSLDMNPLIKKYLPSLVATGFYNELGIADPSSLEEDLVIHDIMDHLLAPRPEGDPMAAYTPPTVEGELWASHSDLARRLSKTSGEVITPAQYEPWVKLLLEGQSVAADAQLPDYAYFKKCYYFWRTFFQE